MLDIELFKTAYKSVSSGGFAWRDEMREKLAEATGCIPIGRSSAYAAMVAVHKDYPDLVIKICDDVFDEYVSYAKAVLNGTLKPNKHHLNVYSVTEITSDVWLVIAERCETSVERYSTIYDDAKSVLYTDPGEDHYLYDFHLAIQDIRDKVGSLDFHSGNIMFRKDGTLVLIDPV
jgi:hypothetical protein